MWVYMHVGCMCVGVHACEVHVWGYTCMWDTCVGYKCVEAHACGVHVCGSHIAQASLQLCS